jgi:hypothetical protein
MDYLLPALLSLFISGFVTFLELITAQYPQTYFLLKTGEVLACPLFLLFPFSS